MPLYELAEGPHRKFYRIERVGLTVELHWGRFGSKGARKVLHFAAEAEARHAFYDEQQRRVDRGYSLVVDESAPRAAVEAPRIERRTLRSHPALEARLDEDPDDEATWMVYEDWLLAERDPRAEIVEHERAKSPGDAAEARGRILQLLLGTRADRMTRRMIRPTWRAGYVRSTTFDAARGGGAMLAALVAAPAARYLTELELHVARFDEIAPVGVAPRLRALAVRPQRAGGAFHAKHLASLAHLVVLQLQGLGELVPAPCLARLGAVELRHERDLDLGFLADAGLTRALRLTIGAYNLWLARTDLPRSLPALRQLELEVPSDAAETALEVVLASGLVAQLASLRIVANEPNRALSALERERFRGGAFAALAELELPRRLLPRF